MDNADMRLPRESQQDIQLAYESLNDWYAAGNLIDKRRPQYFYSLFACFFATLATGFAPSRELLIWLIGRLGIVTIWFGSVSLFLLYADSFRQAKKLDRQINEAKAELRRYGLEYRKPGSGDLGELRTIANKAPFDPYDSSCFE